MMTGFSVALAVAASSSSVSGAASALPYNLEVVTLDNGLRLTLVPFPSPGIVAYFTLVRTGAREEVEPGHTGFAHLFEHMMFRGSKLFPQEEQEALIQRLGYDDNAWTSEDETVYTLYGPTRGLEQVMPREADRFQNLEYSKETLQTETKAVLGEYNKGASDPLFKMEEALLGAAFTRHPYAHTVIGFLADIQAMVDKFDYSKNFFRRFYRPNNCIIFVVGDFDREKVLTDAKRLYASWKGKTQAAKLPAEPAQTQPHEVTVDWPTQTQVRLLWGWRTPSGYQAAAVQELLTRYLLGPTSPLHKDLILTRQIVESLDSWYTPHRDARLFHFSVTCKTADATGAARAAIDREIDRLRAGEIDAKLFADVKSNTRYQALLKFETPSDLASALASAASPQGDPDGLERLLSAIAQTDAQALVDFAKQHLKPENRTVVTLRPAQ